MTAPGRRGDLRRSYSFSAASSSNVDRLTMFIAAWSQLPRSNPRRATGKRLLSLVDPTNDRAASYREIQPRGVEEARLWSGAPSPASMTLLQRELDALSPGSCNCVPGSSHIHAQTCPALPRAADMRAALALGEPVSLTLDSFTPSGLGSFPNPVVPFYAIPPDERARRAVVHGSGCMSRNRATRARPAPPMLVHQFVGQTLWLYWPCTPGNLSRLDDASWTGMVSELEQMHLVVLQPGECIFVPSMSSYITLSLGHGGTNMAAHLKYSLVPHQGSGSTTTVETSGIGSVRARSDEDDVRYQQQHRHTTHQHQHQHQHQHHHHHHQQQQNHHQHHHAQPVPASPQPIGHGGGHASAFGGAYGGRYTDMRELEPYPSRDQDSHVQPSRPSFEQRILGWWKRKDRSRERDPMSHTASGTSMGYGGPVAGPSGRR